MSSADDGLPPFTVIAAALRTTTERLTREVASPQQSPPDWNDFEWSVARAVCAMHGISALLATRLVWRGPPEWQEFLLDQRQHTLARGDHIGVVLGRLDEAARSAGLAYVALKGSAVRELGLHPPGDRSMSDIDLLVRPSDTAKASDVIQSLGYDASYSIRRHLVFAPQDCRPAHSYGEHIDNPLRIEMHQRVREELPVEVVDITDALWPVHCRPGANAYASFSALMSHTLLHAAGNLCANAVRFLHLHEIALLARRMTPDDWDGVLGANPRVSAWWAYPPLSLAARYIPSSIPMPVLEVFRNHCPARLRRRYDTRSIHDVSWCNLRIGALPGLEWSRSWRDSLRFARNRVFPSRTALVETAKTLKALPHLERTRWYSRSRTHRALRWLFSREPRAATITSVRAALAASRGEFRNTRAPASDPSD